MEQLIEQISSEYNLTQEEATGIVDTVKNYLANNQPEETTNEQPAAATEQAPVAQAEQKEESLFEKAEHFVTDHIPGGLKEKAEGMMGGIGDKVKGMFS